MTKSSSPSVPPARSASTSSLAGLVTAVDHVGVAVADLEAAVAWYADTFGLVATHTEINEEQGVREAMLRAPGDTGAAVQLLAPLRSDSPIARFLERNGPGVQQVAYRVTDIDAACAALRAKGLRLLYEAPRRGTADSRINFVHPRDAGGVLVELVQPASSGNGHSRTAEAGDTPQPGYDTEQ
jgi:methylmalonyl-CoA/ethylmalonyl-CoA epimerase